MNNNFEFQGKSKKQVEDSYKIFAIAIIAAIIAVLVMLIYDTVKKTDAEKLADIMSTEYKYSANHHNVEMLFYDDIDY